MGRDIMLHTMPRCRDAASSLASCSCPPPRLLFHVCTRSCLSQEGAALVSLSHFLPQESEQSERKQFLYYLLLFALCQVTWLKVH